MSASQWNPTDVLGIGDIHDNFRCVGTNKSRTAKCNNPIGKARRQEAKEILRDLSVVDVTSDDFEHILGELADFLLCLKSGHSEDPMQQEAKLAEWQWKIEAFAEEEKGRRGKEDVLEQLEDSVEILSKQINNLSLLLEKEKRKRDGA